MPPYLRALRLLGVFNGEHVDFTESGCNRAHGKVHAGRELVFRFLNAFVDELSRPVNIRAILEDHRYLREAVARQRAGIIEVRQTGHRGFDRKGDALFSFQRRVTGRLGVKLHLDVGDVRHSVNGQPVEVENAQRGDAKRSQ